ncbi:MAG: hypothetical protein IJA81_02165 [Akkermansia sp.]|nr:hypothetical protein [Akkermansia sp.]
MQKFGLLLAFAALAGFSQAADPTYTWWNGQDDSMNVSASTTGTWTIGMNLNINALSKTDDGSHEDNGQALFTFTGSGNTYRTGLFGSVSHPEYSNRNVTVTMGWGGDWYATKDENGNVNDSAGNGVYAGLQLGVASAKNPADLSSCNGILSGFEVYRADMKVQNEGVHGGDNGTYDWSIDELQKSTVTTLDDIVTMNVKQATLFVEHTYAKGPSDQLANDTHRDYASDNGNYTTDVTYTTFYLTIIAEDEAGNTVTYNYMGQYDDKSTFSSADEGSRLGGSAHYDVDMIQSITGLNNGMIEDTDFVFVNSALTSAQREALMSNGLPEPTTATMSLLALATLAARRRRASR